MSKSPTLQRRTTHHFKLTLRGLDFKRTDEDFRPRRLIVEQPPPTTPDMKWTELADTDHGLHLYCNAGCGWSIDTTPADDMFKDISKPAGASVAYVVTRTPCAECEAFDVGFRITSPRSLSPDR